MKPMRTRLAGRRFESVRTVIGDSGGVSCAVADGGLEYPPYPSTDPPHAVSGQVGCSYELPKGSTIVLTEDGGPTFAGWKDDCASAGTSSTCALTLDGDKHVGATWADNS
jgi:hypothetical protein